MPASVVPVTLRIRDGDLPAELDQQVGHAFPAQNIPFRWTQIMSPG